MWRLLGGDQPASYDAYSEKENDHHHMIIGAKFGL